MNRHRHTPRLRRNPARPAARPAVPAARLSALEAEAQELREALAVERDDREAQEREWIEGKRELERSRERYAELHDSAVTGFLTLDSQGFIREANLTAARMLGAPRPRLLNTLLSQFVAREHRGVVLQHLGRCRHNFGQDEVSTELRVPGTDGRGLDVLLSSRRAQAGHKPPGRFLFHTALVDITGRKQAEAALRASEAQYRLLFELNPNPMWIFDAATLQFLAVNDAAVKLYGWSREEFLGMTIRDVRPPEEAPKVAGKLARQRGSRAAFVGEWRHWKKDHTPLDVDVTISCLQFQGRDARLALVQDVTERKRAETALRESEERFRRLFEDDLTGDFVASPDGRIQFCNDAFARIYGFTSPKQAIGYNVFRLEAQPETWTSLHSRLKKHRIVQRVESWHRRRDGTPIHVIENLVGVFNPKGELTRIQGYVFDDTQRQRAEDRVRSVALFPQQNPDPVLRALANGQVLYANAAGAAVLRSLGWRRGRPLVKALLVPVRQALKADANREVEVVVPPDRVYSFVVAVCPGEPYVSLYGRDITPRKRAEDQLKQLNLLLERRVAERTEDLTDAYERLRAITDSALVGIITLNERGVIETVNPAALQVFGYAPDEMMGRNISRFMAAPTQPQGEEFLAHYTRPGDQRFMAVGREIPARHKGGHGILLDVTVNDFAHAGRRQFVVMVRDITDRKRLESELLDIGERERQRLGHDLHDGLGQHLHALFYLASLLEQETRKAAPELAREARRLAQQLEHALELSRGLARGLQPVNAVPEGLMVALRELAQRARALYRLDCRFRCAPPVFIHRHSAANHLYRIAQEAVNNAIKHGQPTRIRLKLAASPQRIVLGVRDNGTGIRKRTGRPRGLGLHIMQYRANAISGSLLVHRHPEGGTEVLCTVNRRALLPQEETPQ